MPAQYPLPIFHFAVQWGGDRIGFSEVSGLTEDSHAVEYREGSSPQHRPIKIPGQRKFSNITLKRGVVKSGSDFFKWLSAAKLSSVERRDIIVSLLDKSHAPVMTWKIRNVFPVKITASDLKSAGNEVAIESIEITHEGIELQNG